MKAEGKPFCNNNEVMEEEDTESIGPRTFCSAFSIELLNVTPEANRKSFGMFLNCQQRNNLQKICLKVKSTCSYSIIEPQVFIQEFFDRNPYSYLSLEEIWTLHVCQILPLEAYLANLGFEKLNEFKAAMCELCMFDAKEDRSKEFVQTGMMSYFGRNAVESCDEDIKKVSNCIVEGVLEDAFSLQKEDIIRNRTKTLYSLFNCGTLEKSSLYIFSINALTHFAKISSKSVFEAFSILENCYSNEYPFQVCSVLQKIMQILDPNYIDHLLFEVLLLDATNWQNYAALVHTFIKTYEQASAILSKHIGEMLKKSLQTSNESSFQKAMLMGRQSLVALNPATSYPSAYKQWFVTQFGECQLLKNPQTFSFFLQVLSDLIPHERNVEILKVGLECLFPVIGECQSLHADYKTLLKTRINDLEPHIQPEEVIERLHSAYEESGRIPSYVLEASLVKKHYFLNEFLPVLLTPRVIPTFPDVKARFIEELDKAGKIPIQMLQKYQALCLQMKLGQLAGR